ncbi:spore cortex-lytic enzyme [Paenibacillus gansuensis]|uniref:Spore cortex-lytic enzyme n=1 Tax=Paenibacillus gansuensis TaxID=306542 RepID=A0ABW5PDR7_9BACL
MPKRVFWVVLAIVALLLGLYRMNTPGHVTETFSKSVIKYGAAGKDVRELQYRMKHLGYFFGKVDGQFGYSTLQSLKWFQSEFGIKPDGVAGAETKLKLYNATKNYKPTATDLGVANGGAASGNQAGKGGGGNAAGNKMTPSNHLGLSSNDIRIMANAVYGEARGEPYEGQVAVAAVILNRVKSASFPNTAAAVIYQPGAFTAVADGQINLEPNERAKRAVQDAINGWDPSGGCLYYFNPVTATSKWIWSRPQVKTIGKHVFCM